MSKHSADQKSFWAIKEFLARGDSAAPTGLPTCVTGQNPFPGFADAWLAWHSFQWWFA
jgi:hypothetical protein